MKFCKLTLTSPRGEGWGRKIPKNVRISPILLAFVDPDGNQTIFSRAFPDADITPEGRNRYSEKLQDITLS